MEAKYYLSIIAIFKNETLNLKEWIEHYLWQGVEHLYLIDNDSNDNPLNILQPYIDNGLVSYYFKPEKHVQSKHYNNIYPDIKRETIWCIMADLDEFWYCPNVEMKKILQFLEQNKIDIILSKWIMFGSSGYVEHPKSIREKMIYRFPGFGSDYKYIFQTKNVNQGELWIHHIKNNNLKTIVDNNNFRLNHYVIQSLEFFKKVKMTRGDCDNTTNCRTLEYFELYDKQATEINLELSDMIKKQYLQMILSDINNEFFIKVVEEIMDHIDVRKNIIEFYPDNLYIAYCINKFADNKHNIITDKEIINKYNCNLEKDSIENINDYEILIIHNNSEMLNYIDLKHKIVVFRIYNNIIHNKLINNGYKYIDKYYKYYMLE